MCVNGRMKLSIWMHGTLAAALLAASPTLIAAEDPSPQQVKWMKDLGALTGKIRKGDDVEASAKQIAATFKEFEGFWSKRSETGAKSSKEGQEFAAAIAKAAAAGDTAGVGAASKQLGGTCRSCHDAHREKISDTEYKIK
jgi:cytochrome c556